MRRRPHGREELPLISAETLFLRFLVASAVLIAYGVVVIFAGHGSVPVALLMIFGSSPAWLSSQILGWPGVLVSLAALGARSGAAYLSMRFWGALLLVLSVCAFVSRSEVIVLSVPTALPLLGLWLYFLWRHVASSRARPGVPAPGRPRQVTWAVVGLGITLAVQAASLVPVFAQDSMAPLEVFAVLQCVALSVCAVHTWKGANWARWALIALVLASWLVFAQGSLGALRRLSVDTLITGILLLLDIVILVLLLTRPASAWLRGGGLGGPPDGATASRSEATT